MRSLIAVDSLGVLRSSAGCSNVLEIRPVNISGLPIVIMLRPALACEIFGMVVNLAIVLDYGTCRRAGHGGPDVSRWLGRWILGMRFGVDRVVVRYPWLCLTLAICPTTRTRPARNTAKACCGTLGANRATHSARRASARPAASLASFAKLLDYGFIDIHTWLRECTLEGFFKVSRTVTFGTFGL
jgi:hypothetical protein